MEKGQEHLQNNLDVERNRINLFKKSVNSFSNARRSHNASLKNRDVKLGGVGYVPIQAKINVTHQDPMLDLNEVIRPRDQ